jgi:hypothetical protein
MLPGGSQGDIYQIAATVAELNAIYQVREGALLALGDARSAGAPVQFCCMACATLRGVLLVPHVFLAGGAEHPHTTLNHCHLSRGRHLCQCPPPCAPHSSSPATTSSLRA